MKRLLSIYTIIILMVLAGCSDGFFDMFNPISANSPNDGSVHLSLRMAGGERTLLPKITIDRYYIAFSATGKETVSITTNEADVDISLAYGSWKCDVTGFIEGLESPIVSGTANISFYSGSAKNVPITLTLIPLTGEEGEGAFAFDITLPAALTRAELSLTSLSNNGYTEKIDLLGNNKDILLSVPAGYYVAAIDLCHENFTVAVKTEVVHIYKEQTTDMVYDLTAINFASVPDPIQSYKIIESGPFMLGNLAANQVFAVAVNKASYLVNYSNAGGVASYTLNGYKHQVTSAGRSVSGNISNFSDLGDSSVEQGDKIPLQYDKPKASDFNANPLPIPSVSQNMRSMRAVSIAPPKIGDKRLFWLDDADRTYIWQEKQATLAAVSNNAEIWIIDEYFDDYSAVASDNKLTTAQAQVMAEKFDAIYQYTTPIYGFEYGGGHGSQQPGGVDGNPKITILVYDIDNNNSATGTIGYFWSKDFYSNDYLKSQGSVYKSNFAEIFYIDSYLADARPETVYSTLIHEFVHMINFNEKFVKQNKSYATWYTEMLAMLGEDIVGPLIGISPKSSGHPIYARIPYTLGLYSHDPTSWSGSMSYGITFGFGAYLARNYGGINLVREIAHNDQTNIDSLSAALSVFNPDMNFAKAIERYYEAFICNDTRDRGMASFNKTITNTIEGYQYTLYGFDIYQISRVNVALSAGIIGYWGTSEKGPFLYGLTQNYYLDYYSFILLSCADWRNVSGDMIVDMQKPNSSSVSLHLVVR